MTSVRGAITTSNIKVSRHWTMTGRFGSGDKYSEPLNNLSKTIKENDNL